MALPYGTTGSLCPGFPPVRLVGLAVKLPYANALNARLPSVLREPLGASDTFFGGDHPSQTTHHTLFPTVFPGQVRTYPSLEWYFTDESATTEIIASTSPTYATQKKRTLNIKL